ncbi:MAG TPA: YicC family protein [Spirochaetales bacterium]|nr:YicC family protein [Spirochaetales bacterium]
MTGFSQILTSVANIHYCIAIKSINSRFLDISIQVPGILLQYESQMRETLLQYFTRGKIDVTIFQKSGKAASSLFKNETYLQQMYAEFQNFAKKVKLHKKMQLRDFFNFIELYEKSDDIDPKTVWDSLESAFRECVEKVLLERQKEGTATQKDIESKLQILEQSIISIEEHSHSIESTITESLKKKFKEVMGNTIDENRVLSEIAAYLAKYTINEEIIRFKTHLINFKQTMSESPCGKKLDFISQELNREANTIASKVLIPEISTQVILIKQAIEDIREQIRNIE